MDQERNERLCTFENDGSTGLLEQRRVADELQRVAEALFGMQEDRLARERRALPLRLLENPRHQLLGLPAPFVFCPTFGPTTEQEVQHAQIGVRLAMIGLEFQRTGQ